MNVTSEAKLNLATLSSLFVDEEKARKFLEDKRWPNGPVCPHCDSTNIYTLTAKSDSRKPVRPGVYKCGSCREQFTVRIGTVFEESKIPLRKWLMAIHLMTSSKKGISSHQIAREVGITQKSAWFLCHRIREAMRQEPTGGLLKGTVEADETYVGARKPRFKGTSKRGRGTSKKPVMVLVERAGNARSMPIERVDSATLKGEVRKHVDRSAQIMTDDWKSYDGLDKEFAVHDVICHGTGEYARKRGDGLSVNTNTAESFFALLKRGHYGIFHSFSRKHTHRYCDEFSFRWNRRKVSDGERMVAAIKGAEGKRLTYKRGR
ncbi:MAG: IS1595 family transposase [Phycisphaerae bacterium]|nr:IS1595 family transposase [Phycisphaerae bacterium]